MAKRSKKYEVSLLPAIVAAAMAFTFVVTSISAQEYPAGIVSYWKFDEGSGTVAHDSFNGNHGTIYGANWGFGKVWRALEFDGVDDYVQVPDSANLDISSAITIESWVNPTQIEDNDSFIHKTNAYGLSHGLTSIGVSGKFQFLIRSGYQWRTVSSMSSPVNGNWYHIAGTFDGTELRSYVNGVLENTMSFSGAIDTTDHPVWLGGQPADPPGHGTARCYTGILDEIAIYNRALSAEEIEQHYQNGSQGLGYEVLVKPIAVAGTSLDGNNRLQLDGTLSSDPDDDPLTFNWQIEGEEAPRNGQIASIADLPVGNYLVTLTVSDGIYTDTDTMLFGVPAGAGVEPPPVDELQEQVQNIKDEISSFITSSFDAPNDKAAENRRKALLNMLDKVSEHIDDGDFQAAIDQLEDILVKSDGLSPPDSPPDWIIDDPITTEINEQEEIAQLVSNLIIDLDALL